MKRINDFLDNASLYAVYLAFFALSLPIVFLLLLIFNGTLPSMIMVSFLICVFMSGVFTVAIYTARLNDKFWKAADELTSKIDKSEDVGELISYGRELLEVQKLALGGPHYNKLREMKAVLDTKLKYLNK